MYTGGAENWLRERNRGRPCWIFHIMIEPEEEFILFVLHTVNLVVGQGLWYYLSSNRRIALINTIRKRNKNQIRCLKFYLKGVDVELLDDQVVHQTNVCLGRGIIVPNEGNCTRFKSFQLWSGCISYHSDAKKKKKKACLCLIKSITVVVGGAKHRMKQHYPWKKYCRGGNSLCMWGGEPSALKWLNWRENEKVGAANLFRFILRWAQFSSEMNR